MFILPTCVDSLNMWSNPRYRLPSNYLFGYLADACKQRRSARISTTLFAVSWHKHTADK